MNKELFDKAKKLYDEINHLIHVMNYNSHKVTINEFIYTKEQTTQKLHNIVENIAKDATEKIATVIRGRINLLEKEVEQL